MCIYMFDGRLRFERIGSNPSGFGCRIEPDDDCFVLPPDAPPNVTPNPPVNDVDVDCDFPQTFSVIVPVTDGSR